MFKKVEKEEVFSGLIIVRVLNLIDLFFKTRHVFKNTSIKFDKGFFNTWTIDQAVKAEGGNF